MLSLLDLEISTHENRRRLEDHNNIVAAMADRKSPPIACNTDRGIRPGP